MKRRRFYVVVGFVLACLIPTAAHAQSQVCAAGITTTEGHCSNQFCQDVYPLSSITPCEFDYECILWNSANYDCCGLNGTYWATEAGDCLFSLLKDKNAQSELIALARREEVLVPSCNGAYLPFELFSRSCYRGPVR